MAWTIRIEAPAEKDLKRLDPKTATRILKFLHQRIAPLDNPRAIGEALQGSKLGGLWKYRVGDWRIIANIKDSEITVLILRIGNRRDVYRR